MATRTQLINSIKIQALQIDRALVELHPEDHDQRSDARRDEIQGLIDDIRNDLEKLEELVWEGSE